MNGQYNQNGQRPTQAPQRPPQRPQGQPQRPPQRPQGQPQRQANTPANSAISPYARVSKEFWMVFAITAFLLVISLILSTVLFAFDMADKSKRNKKDDEVVERDDDRDEQPVDETQPSNEYSGSKTDLPYEQTKQTRNNYALTNTSGATSIDGVSSQYAVLVDVSSYKIIADKGSQDMIYPASMTKIMTVIVGCEQVVKKDIKLDELLTVKQEHVDYQQKMGASGNLGFSAGDQVTVENLLYLINYKSDTIACLLIAECVAGSEAEFVKLMNQKASSMGLTGTNFANSTGLYDDNHYTTCADMAAIMAYALDNPMAKKIISAYEGRAIPIYKNNAKNPTRTPTVYSGWYSDRLGDSPKAGASVTIKGGKTGYETIPKCCFVTYAQSSDGKLYICVAVGDASASENAQSTRTIYKNYVK